MSKEFGEELPELDRHTMIRYLLGELPQPWQEHFEEQYFSSDKHFENLRRVEDQLIDDYVADLLSPDAKARFEAHFLSSDRRRRKVELARAIKDGIETASESSISVPVIPFSPWKRTFTVFSVAAAAMLLLCIGVVSWRNAHPDATQTARLETPPKVQPPSVQADGTGSPAVEPSQTASPQVSGSTGNILPVTLTPGTLRDIETKGVTLSLNARISGFRIQIPMTGEPEFDGYLAEIRTPEGKVIKTFDNLAPVGRAKAQILSFVLPSQAIKPGDYLLTLSGKAAGKIEAVDDFQFRVVLR